MRKLLFRTGLFLLPLLALILTLPVERRWRYQHLKNDCENHGLWIHDRIFKQERPIDIAFLGSSNTINALNDSVVEARLGTGERVANLGYCRLGRSLTFVLLQDLLEARRPRLVVIEARQHEDHYSHPVFPYLARESDLLLPPLLFNREWPGDTWKGLSYKVQGLQEKFWSASATAPLRLEPYGFGGLDQTAAPEVLEEAKARRTEREKTYAGWAGRFYLAYPAAYFRKIDKLCRERGVELAFLYLPTYGSPLREPAALSLYQRYGEVWLPPDSIFANPENWMDENHLNRKGAALLTEWVAGRIGQDSPFNNPTTQ